MALPGERTDGHAYLADAIARARPPSSSRDPVADPSALGDVTVIRVADPLAALGAIAAGWRRRFEPLVVGVTGSIAKTSTKEAVAAVLGAAFRTLRNEGNQNNEVGLPLTLLRLGPEHEAAVLEMGMYVGGEIADLARMARPRIGVVTAVQPVHLVAHRLARGDRGGQGRTARGAPARRHRDPQCRRPDRPPDGCPLGGAQRALRVRRPMPTSAPRRSNRPASAGCASSCGPRGRAGRSAIPTLGRLSVHNALAAAAVGRAAGLSLRRDRARAWRAAGRRRTGSSSCGSAASRSSTTATTRRRARSSRRWTCWPGCPGRRAAVLGRDARARRGERRRPPGRRRGGRADGRLAGRGR